MTQVLLIEDNDAVREEIATILDFEGYDVVTAENGRVGLTRLREKRPDVVVCDLMMPEADGYETLQALRRNSETSTIPFLLVTARAEGVDKQVAIALGANAYLTKPVGAEDLLNAIEGCLARPR